MTGSAPLDQRSILETAMGKGNREYIRAAEQFTPGHWLSDKERDPDFIPERVRDALNGCCLAFKPWPLVLLGGVGSGKTCAALCALDKFGGVFYGVQEWVDLCREAMLGHAATSLGYPLSLREVQHRWRATNLGVLDDLGTRREVTDHHLEAVLWAVNARVDRATLPMIVTSNLTMGEIAKVYDDRIASRLGGGTVVTLTGDRRLAKENAT